MMPSSPRYERRVLLLSVLAPLLVWAGAAAAEAFGAVVSRMLAGRRVQEVLLRQELSAAGDERARLEAVIAAIPDGIAVRDGDGRIRQRNDAHRSLLGDDAPDGPAAGTLRDGGPRIAETDVRSGGRTLRLEVRRDYGIQELSAVVAAVIGRGAREGAEPCTGKN